MSEENPFDFGEDPSREELAGRSDERVAIIRTSDRGGFRRCRRKWGWQSHLRGNLTTNEHASPLWFGTGMHYAFEDYHGLRKHGSARAAFDEYVKATYKQSKRSGILLPPDWPDLTVLGRGMCDYYTETWLVARDPLRTFVWNGKPQVEVHALVEVPFKTPHFDKVLYACTLDRVVEDEWGGLWILDYKTAKRFQTLFFQTDPQISAYCWVANALYPGRDIAGFIYQQHRKDVPELPKLLTTGKYSVARSQKTTHRHYRKCLKNLYGDVNRSPVENIDFLNWLETQEDIERDHFVRRDRVYRNEHQGMAEGTKLMLELEEMLNPDIALYPNPTRDCGHLCNFNSACVSMDDGGDWEHELQIGFRQKDNNFDSWRQYLPEEFQ